MTIDDIEFVDAVISIPENAVKLTIEAVTYEDGELHTVEGKYGPVEIRDAINLFQDTIDGDYPVYSLTEKAKEQLGWMKEHTEH
jgi:hypothetical protein